MSQAIGGVGPVAPDLRSLFNQNQVTLDGVPVDSAVLERFEEALYYKDLIDTLNDTHEYHTNNQEDTPS